MSQVEILTNRLVILYISIAYKNMKVRTNTFITRKAQYYDQTLS